jgi:polysaccharide export outer membrane protein
MSRDLAFLTRVWTPARRSCFQLVCLVFALMTFPLAEGASLTDLPPGLVEQLRSMPPAQAQALAQQYGIDLGSLLGGGALRQGPAPGQEGTTLFPPTRGDNLAPGSSFPSLYEAFRNQKSDDREKEAAADLSIEPLDPAERFGLGFFSAEVSTFAPVDNAPVPQDYRLGPGDELQVLLLGQAGGELTLTIDRAGAIALPEIGKVQVAGMTFESAAALVESRVASARIGVKAFVSMGRLRAINVMLAGEVRIPGARALSALSRVSHALFASGGLSEVGSLRRIEVKRSGDVVGRFDAYDLMLSGDSSGDLQLRDGDVVFVPPVARLGGVSGSVRRPGVFELVEGETLEDLLQMAGGPTARGRSEGILLERERPNGGPEIIVLDRGRLLAQAAESGDRLRIQTASQRFSNRVVLRGAVQRPGVYGYFDGMRLSDLLKNPDVDVLENTDLGYGLVVSTNRLDGVISVRQFNPAAIFAAPGGDGDLRLAARDRVLVFSRPGANDALRAREEAQSEAESQMSEERRSRSARLEALVAAPAGSQAQVPGGGAPASGAIQPESFPAYGASSAEQEEEKTQAEASSRAVMLAPVLAQLDRQATPDDPVATVQVEGAVQVPGRYPLGKDYSAADLIAAAGGLRGDAYQDAIEVQRVVLNRDSVAEVQTLSASGRGSGLRELALKSRDRVSVRAIPNWQPDEAVVLEGEFRFPGEYALLPGETLGQLIDRVGGVTVQAFPYGAVYTAQVAAETERAETERFADEIRRSYAGMALTQQQQRATFQELELSIQAILDREALGRIAIDFPRILAGDRGADVVLSDGDKVFMPRRNDTVTVLGEVFRPGSFRFEQGLTLDDYLALGAGATARADQRGLYIVRANGRVERPEASLLRFALNDANVQPGDTIVVPVNASYRDPLDFWTSITQVAYQTGIAIAAVLRN